MLQPPESQYHLPALALKPRIHWTTWPNLSRDGLVSGPVKAPSKNATQPQGVEHSPRGKDGPCRACQGCRLGNGRGTAFSTVKYLDCKRPKLYCLQHNAKCLTSLEHALCPTCAAQLLFLTSSSHILTSLQRRLACCDERSTVLACSSGRKMASFCTHIASSATFLLHASLYSSCAMLC